MSDTLNRLNKLSFYVGVVMKIAMVLVSIFIVMTIILITYIALNPEFVAEHLSPQTYGSVQSMFITMLVGGIVGFVILYVVNRLFMNIYRNQTPFMDDNVRDLRYLAILVLVMAIALPIINKIAAYLFNVDPEVSLNFDIAFLFMAFLLYIVSLIFRYGTALQKESDETL